MSLKMTRRTQHPCTPARRPHQSASARWARGLALLGALWLAACQAATPAPSAATLTPQPPGTPLPAATVTPQAPPSPQPPAATASAEVPPTAEHGASLLAPVAEAAAVRFDSWSSDGQWAAFWLSTDDDIARMQSFTPPGTLHLHNPVTGQTCAHEQFVNEHHLSPLVWQPDGRLLVLEGDVVPAGPHSPAHMPAPSTSWHGTPCQDDFVEIDPTRQLGSAMPDRSVSPGGGFWAETEIAASGAGTLSASTNLREVGSGQVVNRVDWRVEQRLGELGLGGEWITGEHFLIYETLERGPLLLDVAGQVLAVAPDLFGVPSDPGRPEVGYRAHGAPTAGDDSGYHLALYGVGAEHLFPPVRLYHSESGDVEELPYAHLWHPAFSPDGGWLLLDERPERAGFQSNALWARPVDPIGAELHRIGEGHALPDPGWARVIFTLDNAYSLASFPDGAPLQAGSASAGYSLYPRGWSPDGRYAALEGVTGRWQQALFVVDTAAPSAAQPAGEPGFGFTFKYGVCYWETFNTFQGTFRREVGTRTQASTPLALSAEQMQAIHDRMLQIDILGYPARYAPHPSIATGMVVIPAYHYWLTVRLGSVTHSIAWEDNTFSQEPAAVQLRQLFSLVIDALKAHPDVQRLPPAGIGCV
jgi:hypothetical protein